MYNFKFLIILCSKSVDELFNNFKRIKNETILIDKYSSPTLYHVF